MIWRIVGVVVAVSVALAEASTRVIDAIGGPHATSRAIWYPAWIAIAALVLFAMLERRAPIFGRVFWQGPVDRPIVAITFDDGPAATHTEAILDVLRDHHVAATFFVLGLNAERHPHVLARAAREGHEIGNHGFDHTVLPLRGPRFTHDQIARTSAIIERLTGRRPALFRASHGWRNPWTNRMAAAAGCRTVGWTLGVWDTARPGAQEIVRRTLSQVRHGCVLLLHDGRGVELAPDASQVVDALPAILTGLRAAGMEFVTLSHLIEISESVRA